MILSSAAEVALVGLIDKFNISLAKADLLFKNHIRRYNLTKTERFAVMDLFYLYLRHKILIELIAQESRTVLSDVLLGWIEADDPSSLYQHSSWWSQLSEQEQLRLILSLPTHWMERLEQIYTLPELYTLGSFYGQRAPTTLLTLLKRTSREELSTQLIQLGLNVTACYLPTALIVEGRLRSADHLFYDVQDASSQLMAVLHLPTAKRLLDYCAGYGGKSVAFASLWMDMKVVASDIRLETKEIVLARAKRAGIKLQWRSQKELFSAEKLYPMVLVDAPCSGSGVWRRNPEDRYRYDERTIDKLRQTQLDILLQAGKLVEIGGNLLYATCSITYDENEAVIEAFLAKTQRFKVIDVRQRIEENSQQLGLDSTVLLQQLRLRSLPYLRINPQQGGGDLFFAALLQRES